MILVQKMYYLNHNTHMVSFLILFTSIPLPTSTSILITKSNNIKLSLKKNQAISNTNDLVRVSNDYRNINDEQLH